MKRSLGPVEKGHQGILCEGIAGMSKDPPRLFAIARRLKEFAVLEKKFPMPAVGREVFRAGETGLCLPHVALSGGERSLCPRQVVIPNIRGALLRTGLGLTNIGLRGA